MTPQRAAEFWPAFFKAFAEFSMTQPLYIPQPHDWLYASTHRPMSPVWARIDGAHYLDPPLNSAGIYTIVAVPEELSFKVQNAYELDLYQRPTIETPPQYRREMEQAHGNS